MSEGVKKVEPNKKRFSNPKGKRKLCEKLELTDNYILSIYYFKPHHPCAV
jgi:hypothetical protein